MPVVGTMNNKVPNFRDFLFFIYNIVNKKKPGNLLFSPCGYLRRYGA